MGPEREGPMSERLSIYRIFLPLREGGSRGTGTGAVDSVSVCVVCVCVRAGV